MCVWCVCVGGASPGVGNSSSVALPVARSLTLVNHYFPPPLGVQGFRRVPPYLGPGQVCAKCFAKFGLAQQKKVQEIWVGNQRNLGYAPANMRKGKGEAQRGGGGSMHLAVKNSG